MRFTAVGTSTVFLVMTAISKATTPDATQQQSGGALEEIIVTAQKRQENLQSVPIAITPVTAERLAALKIDDVRDLNIAAPGLNVTASIGHALLNLRGVGTSLLGPGEESPIALYVDDVYYADSATALMSFNNIAQIDVLKGPQGTLFGRNATGGLLEVTTVNPTQALGMRASVSYGNYQTATGKFYVTGGLAPDLAIDFAAQYTHQGSPYGTNEANGMDAYQTDHDYAVRSKLRYSPDSGPTVTLIADYCNDNTSQGVPLHEYPGRKPLFGAPYTGPRYDIDVDTQPLQTGQEGGISGKIEQDLGAVRLVSITAFRESHFVSDFDIDGTPIPLVSVDVVEQSRQLSQEIQLLSNEISQFNWVVGGYFIGATSAFDPNRVSFFGPLAAPIATVETYGTQGTNSISAFAQGTLKLTTSTRLTLGARATHEKRTLDAREPTFFSDGSPGPEAIPPINGAQITVTKPTWRVSLDHDLGDDVLVYVSYNRGFKSGGFNAQVPTQPPFQPERIDSYEIGLKTTPFERRLRLNTAAYYYNYKNYQASAFTLGAITVTNADARIYGADLDLEASLTQQLRLNAGLGYNHARFSRFPDAVFSTPLPQGGTLQTTGNAEGNHLAYVPDLTANIGPAYTIPVSGGSITLEANYYYNSGWYPEADNFLHQKHYNLVTASIGWTSADERYWVRAWGKNLTDAAAATQIASSFLSTVIAYQPPRTYGLEAGVKF